MDVADERNLDPALDLAQDRGVFRLWHGDADDLAARLFEPMNLSENGLEIMRIGRGHRLHPDRVVAADDFIADPHFARFMPLKRMLIHGIILKRKRNEPPVILVS